MNTSKNLFKLKLFWFSVLTPLIISIILTLFILITGNLKYLGGYEGLNNLISIFKVPLILLASIAPLVAMVSANNRSNISLQQMKTNNIQDVFSNYFLHLNEFEKFLINFYEVDNSRLSNHINVYLLDTRKVHAMTYGSMYNFIPLVTDEKILELEEKIVSLHELILKLNERPSSNELVKISKTVHCHVETLVNQFGINPNDYIIFNDMVEINSNKVRLFHSYTQIAYSIKHVLFAINVVLKFSNQHITNSFFEDLRNLGTSKDRFKHDILESINSSTETQEESNTMIFTFDDKKIC